MFRDNIVSCCFLKDSEGAILYQEIFIAEIKPDVIEWVSAFIVSRILLTGQV